MRGVVQAAARTTTDMNTLVNRDPNNSISLDDAIERAASGSQLPEHGIPPIEMWLRRVRDEELTPTRVGSRQRHAQRPT